MIQFCVAKVTDSIFAGKEGAEKTDHVTSRRELEVTPTQTALGAEVLHHL